LNSRKNILNDLKKGFNYFDQPQVFDNLKYNHNDSILKMINLLINLIYYTSDVDIKKIEFWKIIICFIC
jgi:hypothetical protein